jgi:diguanylate cyclase (GGDEF)-like protein
MRHVSPPAGRPKEPPDDPALLAQGRDSLTGLLTRDAFFEILSRRTTESLCPSRRFALLALGFERPDAQAECAGWSASADALQLAIASRLRGDIRGADVAARLGGGSFAILLPDPSTETEAQGLATRVVLMMGTPFALDGRTVTMRCRIGIAVFPTDAWEPHDLLRCADVLRDGAGQAPGSRMGVALARRNRPRADWDGRIV